jgi:hypothetical protein
MHYQAIWPTSGLLWMSALLICMGKGSQIAGPLLWMRIHFQGFAPSPCARVWTVREPTMAAQNTAATVGAAFNSKEPRKALQYTEDIGILTA